MRRTLFTLIAAALLTVYAPVKADDLVYSRFGDFLDSLRAQAGVPGMAAAIVGADEVLWERTFGSADLERNIAIRTDTPFHLNGLTELFSSSLVLNCVEQGRLSLDDSIGRFRPNSPDANLTIRQVLTHTTGPVSHLVYQYRPERLDPLSAAIRSCTDDSYRETLGNFMDRSGMFDSVPGQDVVGLVPPAEGVLTSEFVRYQAILERLTIPYSYDLPTRRTSIGRHGATTLTPTSGLISTLQDIEKFDLSLKKSVLLQPASLVAAWRPPLDEDGERLPHGMGWFAQNYLGEDVYWQFGTSEAGEASLFITWPTRGLTFILLANANGLIDPYRLEAGDLTKSPAGKLFLNLFIR